MKRSKPTKPRTSGGVTLTTPQTTRLRKWLGTIGLSKYAALLAEHRIDYETVVRLTEADLEKLGISIEDRKKIIQATARYRSASKRGDLTPTSLQVTESDIKPERRQLTILFCDLVGSTALSVRLDPEDLRNILSEFQKRCGNAIRRYDGHIARFLGDGVLAYFGYPMAHEDDAERAANAALDVVESISEMGALGRLEVRVGIATGMVVVGDLIGEGPAREFALVGEAPNLAARLQQLAQPNQILVAPHTSRLLGGLFELEDLGKFDVKGFGRQIQVQRLVKASAIGSRFEARHSSHLTPLVGRDRELALLNSRYKTAVQGNGQLVLISGEPGIGKSRLVMALRSGLAGQEYDLISLQCSSYHTSSAWYPLIRLLEDEAGIGRDTPPELRLERLERLLETHLQKQSQSVVPLLAALLSIPTFGRYPNLELSPQQQKNRTFAALISLLEARVRRRPVLFVLEDVHWIDPSSMELLERLRDCMAGWRMLAILLFRPEFTLPWSEDPRVTMLTIDRLSHNQVMSMIASVAGTDVLGHDVANEIAAKTDGVPLFIEEMTKAVLEASPLADGGRAAAQQSVFTVPDTLHDSLMARLDQLSSMKTVAQAAAAIGRQFSLDLLEAIVPLPQRDVRHAIHRLLASGLVFRDGPSRNRTYMFKHALVQDEAYASLLRDQRRALDVEIAETLCTKFATIADAAPEIVAFHFTRAGRSQSGINYWQKAAKRAGERSAYLEAGTHLQSAIDLLSDLPLTQDRDRLELQLQQALGSALAAGKGFGASETIHAFHRALELCGRLPNSPETFSVLNGMTSVYVVRGEYEQSRDLAEDLLTRARQQKDPTPMLMGHRALGMSLFLIGQLAVARDELCKSLELYDEGRHGPLALIFSQDFKVTALAYLALTRLLLGDVDGGVACGRDAVAHAEHLRHPHSVCYALAFLAGAFVLCRDPQAANEVANRVVAMSREYGFPLWLAGGQMMGGWALVEHGQIDGGVAEIRHSIHALESTGANVWVHFARYLLAHALGKAGQPKQALEAIDQILRQIASTRGRWYEPDLHRLKGDLLMELGENPSVAEACYERGILVAKRQGAWLWHLRAATRLGALWRSQGKVKEARALLSPLFAGSSNKNAVADLQDAKLVLEANSV
jgi:class 3 adenylate cyclase/predicted ATPase